MAWVHAEESHNRLIRIFCQSLVEIAKTERQWRPRTWTMLSWHMLRRKLISRIVCPGTPSSEGSSRNRLMATVRPVLMSCARCTTPNLLCIQACDAMPCVMPCVMLFVKGQQGKSVARVHMRAAPSSCATQTTTTIHVRALAKQLADAIVFEVCWWGVGAPRLRGAPGDQLCHPGPATPVMQVHERLHPPRIDRWRQARCNARYVGGRARNVVSASVRNRAWRQFANAAPSSGGATSQKVHWVLHSADAPLLGDRAAKALERAGMASGRAHVGPLSCGYCTRVTMSDVGGLAKVTRASAVHCER